MATSSFQTPSESGDVTILLLGETGVGKSTWVNGFANFIEYDTFEKAEQQVTVNPIPSSFTITDENYEERVVKIGSGKNEVLEAGQSATQHPQTYLFQTNNFTIRLIDTPGIGDVRGMDQDKKNFELILDHISHLDHLDLICILLKPNTARLNIMFEFCIKELLKYLHKDALKNIAFCFTNCRSTFYRPGDTLPTLKKLLETQEDISIPLKKDTIYCMDNEAIRFLYAIKDGVQFTEEERENYAESWEKSALEIERLVAHAAGQTPHKVKNTVSLNNARVKALALRDPLVQTATNIQLNIAEKEAKLQELQTTQNSKEELNNIIILNEVDTFRMIKVSQPKTVCTANKCVDFVQLPDGEIHKHFKTQCHKSCGSGLKINSNITNVNLVGHKSIKKCSAFDHNGKCKHCNCDWSVHMKTNYETILEQTIATKQDKASKMEEHTKDAAIQKIEKFIKMLDANIEELRKEQEQILNASSKCSIFLKLNQLTPFHDSIDAHLTASIREERSKVENGGDNKLLEGMKQLRSDYRNNFKELIETIPEVANPANPSPITVTEIYRNLSELKHSGDKFVEMVHESEQAVMSTYSEKPIEAIISSDTATQKPKSNIRKFLGTLAKIFIRIRNHTISYQEQEVTNSNENVAQNTIRRLESPKDLNRRNAHQVETLNTSTVTKQNISKSKSERRVEHLTEYNNSSEISYKSINTDRQNHSDDKTPRRSTRRQKETQSSSDVSVDYGSFNNQIPVSSNENQMPNEKTYRNNKYFIPPPPVNEHPQHHSSRKPTKQPEVIRKKRQAPIPPKDTAYNSHIADEVSSLDRETQCRKNSLAAKGTDNESSNEEDSNAEGCVF